MSAENENILESIRNCARAVPVAELPALIGKLAEASAVAHARLSAPAPVPKVSAMDELLDVDQASARLGVSRSFLYHRKNLPFVRRVPGSRLLRFSARGIEEYLNKNKP